MKSFNNLKPKGPFLTKELADCSGAKLVGSEDVKIHNVATIENANQGEVTFIDNPKYYQYLSNCRASACVINPKLSKKLPKTVILLESENPYLSYSLIVQKFYSFKNITPGIDPSSKIHESSEIGHKCQIESYAVIEENVNIASNTYIGANSVIGPNVELGNNCVISSNVSIRNSLIGNNVIVESGTRIGQDGFGFALSSTGHTKVPQLGYVKIGNDVNIGANCSIDKGSRHSTEIEEGVKLDSQIHVAHNVRIGAKTVIAAQTGIAGSTKIGKLVIIGGQVGISGHLEIGDFAQIGAQAGVTKDVKAHSKISGTPAVPLNMYLKQAIKLKKIVQTNVKKVKHVRK